MSDATVSPVAQKAAWHAIGELGVQERGAPNRGPEVDEYLKSVGLDPAVASYPWCVAFLYWCFKRASADLGVANPMPKTASVVRLWTLTASRRTQVPTAGSVFCRVNDAVHGHAGLVLAVGPSRIVTVEGNTNAYGGREGNAVCLRYRQFHDVAGYILL
jgi:hypothetical protein